MKKLITPFLSLMLLTITACNNNVDKKSQSQTDKAGAEQLDYSSKGNLLPLADLNGSYPMEVNLLDNPLIQERLKNLLGSQYPDFRKYWNVETPIMIENNILSTTGCEQHNCGANQYIMQIDLMENNINVYHIGTEISSFQEKGPINLPTGLAKDFEIMKGNMVH